MKRYFQTFFTQQKQNIPLLVDDKIVHEPGEFIPVSLEYYNNLKNSIMIAKKKDTKWLYNSHTRVRS